METIERDELKAAIERGDDIKLVMTMHEHQFEAAHIPGSVQVFSLEQAAEHLNHGDHIIVYCSHRACPASSVVGQKLVDAGYADVRHYPGGLADWADSGYPLEGGSA